MQRPAFASPDHGCLDRRLDLGEPSHAACAEGRADLCPLQFGRWTTHPCRPTWPRGISKSKARLDAWLKDLAPSAELRVWFNHEPARWIEFRQRYLVELAAAPPGLAELRAAAAAGPVTLLHAARDEAHNNARVLADYLVGGT